MIETSNKGDISSEVSSHLEGIDTLKGHHVKKQAPEGEEFDTFKIEEMIQVTLAGVISHRIHHSTKTALYGTTVERDNREERFTRHEQFNGTTYKGSKDRIQTPDGDV